jgi:hypothetical protein
MVIIIVSHGAGYPKTKESKVVDTQKKTTLIIRLYGTTRR